jgi:hypothetical protein
MSDFNTFDNSNFENLREAITDFSKLYIFSDSIYNVDGLKYSNMPPK